MSCYFASGQQWRAALSGIGGNCIHEPALSALTTAPRARPNAENRSLPGPNGLPLAGKVGQTKLCH